MGLLHALKVAAPKVAEPWSTLEKRLTCPHCQGSAYVRYPWNATEFQRVQQTREAIDEHRRNCPKAPATEARVTMIDYPRV